MLNENSLYTNDAEKIDFLKNKHQVADTLLFNLFGFVSMFAAYPKPSVKAFKNTQEKIRINDIIDTNTDISLSIRLAYDVKLISTSTANKLTRLLALFKQGKINKATDVDDTLVHELFEQCKFDSKCKVSSELLSIVYEYNERHINIAYLARLLYKKCKLPKFKTITQEFSDMYRKGGYNSVYSDFETGYTKLKMGVPKQYVRKSTDKTISFETHKQIDAKGIKTFTTTLKDNSGTVIDTKISTLDPFATNDDKETTDLLTVDDIIKVADESNNQHEDQNQVYQNKYVINSNDSDKVLSEIDDPLLRFYEYTSSYCKEGKDDNSITSFFNKMKKLGKNDYQFDNESIGVRTNIMIIEALRFQGSSDSKVIEKYIGETKEFYKKYNIQLPNPNEISSKLLQSMTNTSALFSHLKKSLLQNVENAKIIFDMQDTEISKIFIYLYSMCNESTSDIISSYFNYKPIFKNTAGIKKMKEEFIKLKEKYKFNNKFLFLIDSPFTNFIESNEIKNAKSMFNYIDNNVKTKSDMASFIEIMNLGRDYIEAECTSDMLYNFFIFSNSNVDKDIKTMTSLFLSSVSNLSRVSVLKKNPHILAENSYKNDILDSELDKIKNFDFDLNDLFTADFVCSEKLMDLIDSGNETVENKIFDKFIEYFTSNNEAKNMSAFNIINSTRFYTFIVNKAISKNIDEKVKNQIFESYISRLNSDSDHYLSNTDISMIPYDFIYNTTKERIDNLTQGLNDFVKNIMTYYNPLNYTDEQNQKMIDLLKDRTKFLCLNSDYLLNKVLKSDAPEILTQKIASSISDTKGDFKDIDVKKTYLLDDILKVSNVNYKEYVDLDKLRKINLTASTYTKFKKLSLISKEIPGDCVALYLKVLLAKELYNNKSSVFKTSIKANKPLSEDAKSCINLFLQKVDITKVHISLFEFYNSKSTFNQEDYKNVIHGFESQLEDIVENPRFEILTYDRPKSYDGIAYINGIGFNLPYERVEDVFKAGDDLLTLNERILFESINYDLIKEPVMKIDEVINDSKSLEDETNELNTTLNGKHGNVKCVVDTIYNINMDSTLFEQFKISDAKKKNSTSKGEVTSNMFHGTGSIAINFISKFGFADVSDSSSGIEVAGKMLGSGIYFAKNIDKSLSYIGDVSFRKSYKSGYVIVCDVILGVPGSDYREASSNVLSPEWCIKNYKEQILVRKILKVRSEPN